MATAHGLSGYSLLNIGGNHKTNKSDALGEYKTAIMYLAPASTSRVGNVCPHSSDGCRASCLFTAGMAARLPSINKARVRRTKMFFRDRNGFLDLLTRELFRFVEHCAKYKVTPAVRLNGTSDIVWEQVYPELFNLFRDVQFYDYTKIPVRMTRNLPDNYHLTFSRSESNERLCLSMLGGQLCPVTAVFDRRVKHQGYPKLYKVFPVVNGDEDDLRFTDPPGCWIGLYAKGRAMRDNTGFVIREF